MIITYEYFDREILIDAFEMRLGFVINIERFFELPKQQMETICRNAK